MIKFPLGVILLVVDCNALKDFVTQRWTELDGVLNGARFVAGSRPVVRAVVREARWPVRMLDSERAAMDIVVDSIPRSFVLGERSVESFCAEIGLEGSNCDRVQDAAAHLAEQVVWWQSGQVLIERTVCVAITSDLRLIHEDCLSEAAWREGRPLPSLPPGRYIMSATEKGGFGTACEPGTPQTAKSRLYFEISDCAQTFEVSFANIRHGAIIPTDIDLTLDLTRLIASNTTELCLHLDSAKIDCQKFYKYKNLTFSLKHLSLGRHHLELSIGTSVHFWCSAVAAIDVEVRADWALRSSLARLDSHRPRLITAVSERYVRHGMLENLVGSIHFWDPAVLEVYDLGLSESAVTRIKSWHEVILLDLAQAASRVLAHFETVPEHILRSGSYAFKPIVLADALQRSGTSGVLWLDANVELRRPLDELLTDLAFRGHFLVEHPFRFPTAQFHYPTAVSSLGCRAPDFSRQHCATTIIGLRPHSWFATQVLPVLVDCAANSSCINPPGSSRANHRQEQTALNAILCRLGTPPDGICNPDKRFRLTSDFENDHDALQPTADESDWNDLCLYTRRDFPIKPYRRFVRLHADEQIHHSLESSCSSSVSCERTR